MKNLKNKSLMQLNSRNMMQIKTTMLCLTTLILIMMSGCGKDDEDTTAPQIVRILINEEEQEEALLEAGDSFEVRVEVQDNESLNQLKINIHPAGDGHSHESGEEEQEMISIGTWSENQVTNIVGEAEVVEYTFSVPEDILGFWHLEVFCIDEKGNEAEERIVTLQVENAEYPEIAIENTIPEQNESGEIEAAPGSSISFAGNVSDDDGLAEVHVELEDESSESILWEMEYDINGSTNWNLNQVQVAVPDDLPAGSHLHLHLHASDSNGFENSVSFEVHIE